MFTSFIGPRTEVIVINADGSRQAILPLAGKHFDNRVDWGPLPAP